MIKFLFKDGSPIKSVVVKNGYEVDPDSDKDEIAHVLMKGSDGYTSSLIKTSKEKNKNSYYKMQVLESDKKTEYWWFCSWGRIGTTNGENFIKEFQLKQNAIQEFEKKFLEKTGNKWADRKHFVKRPNKYYPVELDYELQRIYDRIPKMKPGDNSSLAQPIQELICMIFDKQTMEDTLIEFELDLEKMPLGKLSCFQFFDANLVLTELKDLIEKQPNDKTKILDATNKFFSLVPHNFGLKKVPLIDNQEKLKAKEDMLGTLLQIEIAYTILQSTDNQGKGQVDQCYEKLDTKLEVLDKTSNKFNIIEKYFENGHGSTHNNFKMEIMEVFEVERNGENERYKKFKEMDNHMLLWHGSRTTNFAGILSEGLRIAPPEAPSSGCMFGKGIYFADMASKSANYIHNLCKNPVKRGLLLLSEVAVGNP